MSAVSRDVLETRVVVLRRYLEWYANPENYELHAGHNEIGVLRDRGWWAREGLRIAAPVDGERA